MDQNSYFIGCFVSYPSLVYPVTKEEQQESRNMGDLFSSYIWGEKGISDVLKLFKHEDYGKDLLTILFQFYVKPIPYLQQNLKEIENYRKGEKSIGIPIIVNNENFFIESEEGRYRFLKQSILIKLNILAEVVRKKKLDINIELLKDNISELLRKF